MNRSKSVYTVIASDGNYALSDTEIIVIAHSCAEAEKKAEREALKRGASFSRLRIYEMKCDGNFI